jgi:FAD/FMN-containing dehydrogenase
MHATTMSGQLLELGPDLIDGLKERVRGKVLLPADAGYDEARTLWNGMHDRRPALVVRPLDVADVVTAVHFARERGLLICIRGGGHNIAGLAVADGGLLLDMSLMRGVIVDAERRIAHAQAGCLLGDVDRETQLHGLATVLGFVSQTGIAGLTLGGGFGYLTRRWGWTTDNVVGMELVTADGRIVRASDDENADLFWGLRGGGGNFGVVTGIDYTLHEVGPEVIGGLVAWHAADAPGVLSLFRELAERAPRELTLVALMRDAPPAPWLPAEIHGKPIVGVLACYSGPAEEGERLLAPLKAHGSPVGDVVVRRPYTQLQSLLDTANPNGRRYYWKSEYLPALNDQVLETYRKHAALIPSPFATLILFQIGGALNELPEDHSPVGNRDATWVLNISGSWASADDDARNIAWARDAWNDFRPHSTGGTYLNFLNQDDGADRMRDALGDALDRLAQIKARWDPDNLFRTNRNIVPA